MISEVSVRKLNRLSKKNNIWCMGCGKRFYEMIDLYQEEPFVVKIVNILDNNPDLWGQSVTVVGKEIAVNNVECLKSIKEQEVILVITSDSYEAIYRTIESVVTRAKIKCFLYPYYYSDIIPYALRILGPFVKKRQLLFYAGSEPHDNADAIVNYLYSEYNGRPFKVVYLQDTDEHATKNIISVNKWTVRKKSRVRDVVRFCFYYGTSRYLLYENEILKKGSKYQKLIYLNHGTIPLKKVNDVLKQPKHVDYGICPSIGCSELYSSQYGIEKSKQLYMMPPRSRDLFIDNKELVKSDKEEKIILWLPTFRQLKNSTRKDSRTENPCEVISSYNEWMQLNEVLKDNNLKLLIKKHPREKQDISCPDNCSQIHIVTDEGLKKDKITLHQLLAIADALLTDYSGIAFEYMLLERPIGYVIKDIEGYIRGFAVDNPYEYMPGEKISNFAELNTFFDDIRNGKDKFANDRKMITERIFGGNINIDGAQKLIEWLDEGKV